MTIDVTVVANDGQVIEVSIGDGAAVFEALDSISEQLATKVDAGGAAGAAPVQSVAGKAGNVSLVKGDVGLNAVDNTADSSKPVSTAQAAAIAAAVADKVTAGGAAAAAPVQSVAGKAGNVALVKGDVGLSAVDNTADSSKPVSTAQAAAIAGVATALVGERILAGLQLTDPSLKVSRANLLGFVDHRLTDQGPNHETVGPTSAHYQLVAAPANLGILSSNVAIGGTSYYSRNKGTPSFNNTQLCVEYGAFCAHATGRSHVVRHYNVLELEQDRGLQLTGRDNYETYGKALGLPLLTEPDLAADPADSLIIAREFWRRGNVNDAIDRGDFRRARQITNGGTIGLEAVAARRARLLKVLA